MCRPRRGGRRAKVALGLRGVDLAATAEAARSILGEERAMAARLRAHFDAAVDATLADTVSEEA